ncbi:MAG TPA: PAS domain S-box protein, partial [Cyclobacteriaceae bacterium]|nr:PAS domain S-box protein [Cyclobacteriaceae bacterium]
MTNHSSDLIFAMNEEFRLQEVNEAFQTKLDYDSLELKNSQFTDLVEENELFFVLQLIEKSKSDGKETSFQTQILRNNRSSILVELEVSWDREDRLYYCTARDLSKRTDTAAAISDSEESFHYLFMENPSPMLIWDFTTLKFLECNTETLKLYGYTREEFLQLSIIDIRPPEDIPLILEASKTEQAYRNIKKRWRHLKKNGEVICMEIKSSLINFRGSRAALVHLNDVTSKVNAEEELFRTY